MKWSWKIGEFAGIGVYMHATFLLLLGWVALVHWQDGQNPGAVVAGLAFVLALFACVVAHEYGHALTARRYGSRRARSPSCPLAAWRASSACPTTRARSCGWHWPARRST